MKPNKFSFFLAILFLGEILPAFAGWTSGEGEYLFGPETAEKTACDIALERARIDAIQKIHGEFIRSDQTLSCREVSDDQMDNPQCQANRMLWSQIGGELRATRVIGTEVIHVLGARSCRVRVVADVAAKRVEPPPDFDIGVALSQNAYRPGEKLQIELMPTQVMHVAIFNWLPYAPEERQVIRIYPNSHDLHGLISSRTVIPGPGYSLMLDVPDVRPVGRSFIDEYLLIVISKDFIAWLDVYSIQMLRDRLAEIPPDRVRLIKRGYQLLMPASSNR